MAEAVARKIALQSLAEGSSKLRASTASPRSTIAILRYVNVYCILEFVRCGYVSRYGSHSFLAVPLPWTVNVEF